VSAHIRERTAELLDAAASCGLPLVTPRASHAGIACFRPSDAAAMSSRLNDAGVAHSVREGTIRLSPHCYTTREDVQAVARLLAR
jgi:selenocysteine lyase/cysteine desulfurase